jgi:hypothetical protein
MKKYLSLALVFVLVASLLTGCAKAKDAAEAAVSDAISDAVSTAVDTEEAAMEPEASQSAGGSDSDTASAFYGAYIEAKSAVLDRLMDGIGSNPDTMMSAFSFLGITMSDLYLLPAMYFGLDESSVAAAMAFMGAKDVSYSAQGNNYTVTYHDSDDKEAKLVGTYDKGNSLLAIGTTAGTENVFAETYRTAFGYVGQFYFLSDDGTATLYQVAVSGQDGVFGITTGGARPSPLTGKESVDFPKSASEWYAIFGDNITGLTAEGKSVNFTYVPTDNEG